MDCTDVFSKIRFIGYALPTTPAELVSIGDPNGPGAVAGVYLADSDFKKDFRHRIKIMKNAVDLARKKLPKEDGVINLFVAPEFYFHGTRGPYIYQDSDKDPVSGSTDPVLQIKEELASTFNGDDYPNWTFFFGSVISSLIREPEIVLNSNSAQTRNSIVKNLSEQWQKSYGPLKGVIFDMLVNFIKVCHSYPNCEVRNRCIIVSNIPISLPGADKETACKETNLMTTEKYFVSNEDFLLYERSGKPVITEQMTAYPPIDLSRGDAKRSDFDEYAIFRQDGIGPVSGSTDRANSKKTGPMDYGVEICLDHSDTRLRRNIDNKTAKIKRVHVQVIPSCGMQIIRPNVAADDNGFVFNCDGQYNLNKKADTYGKGDFNEVKCLYADYTYPPKANPENQYKAHSQLARVKTQAKGGDPNVPKSSATFHEFDDSDITVINVADHDPPPFLNDYFAGGAGQLHIYGLKNPYTLY